MKQFLRKDGKLDIRVRQEIALCAQSIEYCRKYAQIKDKRSRTVQFQPNEGQVELARILNKYGQVFNLKARQLGMSTEISWRFFHKALFIPGFEVLITAHKEKAAIRLLRI